MQVTILGSGTSTGVPMIGRVKLQHRDPKNQRLRASCLVEPFGAKGPAILLDTSPDLRQQVLHYFPKKKPRLDAVLITHEHADHLHGIDDVRAFNFIQNTSIPFYGEKRVMHAIQSRFPYIFSGKKFGIPQIELHSITTKPFVLKEAKEKKLQKLKITPLPTLHGKESCLGYRIFDFAYITDCKQIPPSTIKRLEGLELLVLDCLRWKDHHTHLTVEESFAYAKEINAKRTIFTHMASDLEYHTFSRQTPPRCRPAYDGLKIKISKKVNTQRARL